MYNVKPGQLVQVKWLDPTAGSHWTDVRKIRRLEMASCCSVGWVHLVTDEGLMLTACFSSQTGGRDLLFQQSLPWGCITEIWILET